MWVPRDLEVWFGKIKIPRDLSWVPRDLSWVPRDLEVWLGKV